VVIRTMKISTLILAFLLLAIPAWGAPPVLTWTDVSTLEDGFAIEQNGPGGWVEIGRVGPNAETYTDNASPDEGCYRVGSFITLSGVDVFSVYSNKACKINGVVLLVQ